jgi:DNA-directed RNA polymerase I subunit RPA1
LNKFSLITLSGAKGSILNTFQLSLNLGQTELESKCTPRNLGGKTLPVFFPFEINAFSNGFIFNRFITGLNQSDFFFHCMAGREGLLDTAVKTSQSGYIQRSLIKHLESIILSYDHSVRFSKGFVNQFIYSKNGCSTMSSELKTNLNWIVQNFCLGKVEGSTIKIPLKKVEIKTNLLMNLKNLQSLPKIDLEKMKSFFKKNQGLRKVINILDNTNIFGKIFLDIFRKNLLVPGEALGVTTGQSIGEPCTQMTLNTFHFAGKLDSNQKTGVPRLKEILLLGSKFPVTPTMSGKINNKVKSNKFSILQMRFKRVKFDDLISCFSSFIEKTKDFEGHIIRFSFQKKFLFKHLLSIRTKTLKKIIENFGTRIKKMFMLYLKRHFKKILDLSNNLINPNDRKFDNQLSKKRLNLII